MENAGNTSRRSNASLAIGIAIPILMVLFVGACIYLPALFAPKPRENFLYELTSPYPQESPAPGIYTASSTGENVTATEFFIYDVSNDTSSAVSSTTAAGMQVSPGPASSDGYTVIDGNSRSVGFPFFFDIGGDYDSEYLEGHGISRRLNISLDSYGPYYEDEYFRFLGWIAQ